MKSDKMKAVLFGLLVLTNIGHQFTIQSTRQQTREAIAVCQQAQEIAEQSQRTAEGWEVIAKDAIDVAHNLRDTLNKIHNPEGITQADLLL